jgi:drug/metabolite transporter (DMT)-like permease
MDGLVKSLATIYPIILIAWWRFAIMSTVLLTVIGRGKGWRQFRTRAPGLQLLRAMMVVVATSCFYTGLRHLPLAECTAIMFLSPALSAVLGYLCLRERPSRLGWLVILISATGVLLVTGPLSGAFESIKLIVLIGALAHAVFTLLTRVLAPIDAPRVTTFWSSIGTLIAFSLVVPKYWETPHNSDHLMILLGIGLLGTAGQLLFSQAFRHGYTHVIAPLSYLSLPTALLIGLIMFGERMNFYSLLGIGLILFSAVLVALGHTTREAPA